MDHPSICIMLYTCSLSTGPPLTICIMLYTCSNISRLVPFDWTTPDYMHYVIYMFKYLSVIPFDWTTPDYMHYVYTFDWTTP